MPLFRSARADRSKVEAASPTLSHAMLALEKRYVFDAALAGELADLADVKTTATHDTTGDVSLGTTLLAAGAETTVADTSHVETTATTHALFVIDAGIADKAAILAGLPAGADVVILDASRDGVAQIAEALASRSGIDQIHLFAHGGEGTLTLGASVLDAETMSTVYRATLAGIGSHLSETADILVYGCDFAEGADGRAAADLLAALTGADVAASTDLTGAAVDGGDWTLEYASGSVEAHALAFDGFHGTLAVASIAASGAPTTNGLHNVGASATWANVATVAGQPIDIRATVISADASAQVNFGVTGNDLRMELQDGAATVKWELFYAGTTNPITADVNFQITDLDGPNIEYVSAASDSYTVEAATHLSVSNAGAVITAAGTQNQNSESNSMIRFSWGAVSSMTVDYTAVTGNDIRIFNHDGNLDLTFSNPVTVAPPILDLDTGTAGYDYATTFTENGAAVSITDPTVSVTNSTGVTAATIVLTNAQSGDTLALGSLPAGITGSVDTSVAGQITVSLSGSATAAAYQTALAGITFANSSDTPNTTARTITFQLQDGVYTSNTTTTTIAVVAVNDPPVALDDTASTVHDTVLNASVAGNDSDPEGDTLSYSLLGGASHGSVTVNADGSYTYTPTAGYVGADAFTYTADDGNGGTDTATVSISVTNAAPVAGNDTATTAYETPVSGDVSGNDSDPNGDALTYALATGPAHGSVIVNANGTYGYTPANGYSGADSFGYTVSDGVGGTATATVNITVGAAPNSPPNAVNDTATTATSTPVSGDVSGNDGDPNGDTLSFALASGPAHGSVIVNANGTYTYTPTAGYAGADAFTYTADDGHGGTASATVNITVTNAAPVAGDDTVTTAYETPASGDVSVNDSDANGDTLTYALATGPAHGSVTLDANGTFGYTPAVGYNGADVFTYTVSDGRGGTASATVNITVGARPNTAPVAVNDTLAAVAGQPTAGNAAGNDTDADGDTLTYALTGGPSHGTVTLNANGTYTYTATAGWSGADSFAYSVDDGFGGTASATVSVSVDAPPVLAAISAQTGTDAETISLDLGPLASDVDGPSLSWSATGLPTGLAIDASTGVISGTIDRAASAGGGGTGVYSVSVTVADGAGGSANRTFSWTVTNPAPIAADDAFSTTPDTAVNGSVGGNDADPDGDALTWAVATAPTHGSVTVAADGTFTYTPTTGYVGTDTFGYTVTDAQGATATATVTVTVANRAPVAVGTVSGQTSNDHTVASLATAAYFNDPDGQSLTYSATGLPTGLTIDASTGVISGTIASGASGTTGHASYPIVVTATDPLGASVTQSFAWAVNNVAPVAVADAFSTAATTAVAGSVAGNDSDADLDTLTYALTGQAGHGTVTFQASGAFSYTPNPLFAGVDTFTYTVSDGNGGTSTATVRITVAAPTVLPTQIRCVTTFGNLAYLRRLLW